MSQESAKKFLQSVANDPAQRAKLHDALLDDLVAAAKAKGFNDVTGADLDSVLRNANAGGAGNPASLGVSIGWS